MSLYTHTARPKDGLFLLLCKSDYSSFYSELFFNQSFGNAKSLQVALHGPTQILTYSPSARHQLTPLDSIHTGTSFNAFHLPYFTCCKAYPEMFFSSSFYSITLTHPSDLSSMTTFLERSSGAFLPISNAIICFKKHISFLKIGYPIFKFEFDL